MDRDSSLRALDSSVEIVTSYGLDGWGLVPSIGNRCFFTPQHPKEHWGPPSLLYNVYQGFFSTGVKWSGSDDNHTPSSTKVKAAIHFYSSTHLHGMVLN